MSKPPKRTATNRSFMVTGVIVILIIAALCWGAVLAYRGSVLVGCALYLITTCCFSNEFWSLDAAGLTWALDRFFLLGLVGLFAAQVFIRRTEHKPLAPGDLLLAAFLAVLLVSTFTHDWRTLGPDRVSVLMHLVNGYLIPATLFWIAREAQLNERAVRFMHAVLACFGLYLAFTALCEIFKLWPLVFPGYIADRTVGIHFGRARGPMVQSARLGTYLIACFVATGTLVSGARHHATRLLPVLLLPLYAAAVYFTYTRSVWMGTGLAAALAVALLLRGRRRNVALAGMVAAALCVLVIKGSDFVSMERETSGAVTRESTYMRVSFAYVSWQMFKDHPLTGVGFGHFPRKSPYYLSDRETALHLEAIRGYIHHNTFLSVLVELGLAGFVLFLFMLFEWVRSGLRLCRDPEAPAWMRGHALFTLLVFAPYSCQLMFREVSYSPQENSLIFLLAGVTSGLCAMRARQRCVAPHGRHAPAPFALQGAYGAR